MIHLVLKNCLILAMTIMAVTDASAAILFRDTFTGTDGQKIENTQPVIGGAWTGSSGAVFNDNTLDTTGEDAGNLFGIFTRPLGPAEVLTLSYDTLALDFGSSWAGVSLFEGTFERIFTGSPSSHFNWGVQIYSGTNPRIATTDNGAINTATFTYEYDTGKWTFTTLSGNLSGDADTQWALDRVRVANGTKNIRLDNLQVNAVSAVPEPGTFALWLGLGAAGVAWMRRRKAVAAE